MQFIELVAGNLANSSAKNNKALISYSFCQQLFAKWRRNQSFIIKSRPRNSVRGDNVISSVTGSFTFVQDDVVKGDPAMVCGVTC